MWDVVLGEQLGAGGRGVVAGGVVDGVLVDYALDFILFKGQVVAGPLLDVAPDGVGVLERAESSAVGLSCVECADLYPLGKMQTQAHHLCASHTPLWLTRRGWLLFWVVCVFAAAGPFQQVSLQTLLLLLVGVCKLAGVGVAV